MKNIVETKTKIIQEIYTIFIADSLPKVKAAANCKAKSDVNFYSKIVTVNSKDRSEKAKHGNLAPESIFAFISVLFHFI